MLTQKPIVYFQYDLDKYRKLRGHTLVSDDLFIAGELVFNTEQLLTVLFNIIGHPVSRPCATLLSTLKINEDLSSPQIIALVKSLNQK